MIEWETSNAMLCSQCRQALTVPHAHVHFHYGTEGMSAQAQAQMHDLVGRGHGDDTGKLGQDMCMACFRELVGLVARWRRGGAVQDAP